MYNTLSTTIDNIVLYIGESKRIDCPVCKGYKTFTVSNMNGNIVWNCYKASCGVSGGRRTGLTPASTISVVPVRRRSDSRKVSGSPAPRIKLRPCRDILYFVYGRYAPLMG